MEELKIGDYIRTHNGTIFKIVDGNIDKWYIDICYWKLSRLEDEDYMSYAYNKNNSLFCSLAKKINENIIELLEVGDVVTVFSDLHEVLGNETFNIRDERHLKHLKTGIEKGYFHLINFVTKEQFNSAKYDVEG